MFSNTSRAADAVDEVLQPHQQSATCLATARGGAMPAGRDRLHQREQLVPGLRRLCADLLRTTPCCSTSPPVCTPLSGRRRPFRRSAPTSSTEGRIRLVPRGLTVAVGVVNDLPASHVLLRTPPAQPSMSVGPDRRRRRYASSACTGRSGSPGP